jgi:hypothetical protein
MTFMIFVTFISIHFVIICDVLLWRIYEMHPTLSLEPGCDSTRDFGHVFARCVARDMSHEEIEIGGLICNG